MVKHKLFLQWWFIFTLVLLGTLVAASLEAFQTIYAYDFTKLSFVILAIFGVMSLICGATTYVTSRLLEQDQIKQEKLTQLKAFEEAGWFASDMCLTIGMIGTVVGFIFMLMGSFQGIDSSDTAAIQKTLGQLASGMSTALFTTLVGLVSSVLLKLQFFNLSQGIAQFDGKQ